MVREIFDFFVAKLLRCSIVQLEMAIIALCSAYAAEDIYIYQVLQITSYRKSYIRLIENQQDLPEWIASADAASRAVGGPREVKHLEQDGSIELFQLCEPHNCGGTYMIVGFEQSGEIAKAALADTTDNIVRFFGNPNPEERKVLIGQLDGTWNAPPVQPVPH